MLYSQSLPQNSQPASTHIHNLRELFLVFSLEKVFYFIIYALDISINSFCLMNVHVECGFVEIILSIFQLCFAIPAIIHNKMCCVLCLYYRLLLFASVIIVLYIPTLPLIPHTFWYVDVYTTTYLPTYIWLGLAEMNMYVDVLWMWKNNRIENYRPRSQKYDGLKFLCDMPTLSQPPHYTKTGDG